MSAVFREYRADDYFRCESLVNEAREFDKNFQPQALADVAKLIYTKGSEINSNYKKVVEIDGDVVGFIFGLNSNAKKPKGNFIYGLKLLWTLLGVKPIRPGSRKELLNAFHTHEANRSQLIDRGNSEIVLFVVSKDFKRNGLRTRLWSGFLSYCKESSVKAIVVETNRDDASTFYERLGFELVGEFESPVHQFAAPNGQACMYEYRCE